MPRSRASTASTRSASVVGYLNRLRIDDPGEPSVAALSALHRAHVERVPYEVLDVQLGRPTTVDPADSLARVLRRRGGYCVQLNGAFSALLTALGYHVSWHRAGVHAGAALPPVSSAAPAPHLALTVEFDGETWLVDVGLGDGLHEPLPLRSGTYRQGPFAFHLGPSRVDAGGWRFDHDPRGSIAGIDVTLAPAGRDDFAEWHPYLSTSAESRLVRTAAVMRRDADGADSLVGCMLRRVHGAGKTVREIATSDDWFGALADVFDLPLADLDTGERARLWAKVRAAHEAWLAAKTRAAA
jgi:arylamine N-acetyltransferase